MVKKSFVVLIFLFSFAVFPLVLGMPAESILEAYPTISPLSVNESSNVQYNLTIDNVGKEEVVEVLVVLDNLDFEFVGGSDLTSSVNASFSNVSFGGDIILNWSNYSDSVIVGGDGFSFGNTQNFFFNATPLLSGFNEIIVVISNQTANITQNFSIEVETSCSLHANYTACDLADCEWEFDMQSFSYSCGDSMNPDDYCAQYSNFSIPTEGDEQGCLNENYHFGCFWDSEYKDCMPVDGNCSTRLVGTCEDFVGCVWNGSECLFDNNVNVSKFIPDNEGCFPLPNASACSANTNCTWEDFDQMCMVNCVQYDSFSGGNESVCSAAFGGSVCAWEEDWFCKDNPGAAGCENNPGICDPVFFNKGFDGFSPCFEFDGNKTGCDGMSAECAWFSEPNCLAGDFCYNSEEPENSGFCNPKGGFDFGGDFDCFEHDGDKDACKNAIEQSQWACSWNADPWGALINGTEAGWCTPFFSGDGGNGGGSCWDYGNEDDCSSASDLGLPCSWKSNTGAFCEEKGCWNYWDIDSCSLNADEGCVWDVEFNHCQERGCWDLGNESSCGQASSYGMDCSWKNDTWGNGGQCEENGCWNRDWTNTTYCEAKAGCSWDGSHCNERGCWDYGVQEDCINDTLTGSSCNWNTEVTGWCEQEGCWSYEKTNQSACENLTADYGMDCVWENSSGQEMCFEQIKGCSDNNNEFECFATGWCTWNGTECKDPVIEAKNFWNPGCWVFDQAGESKCSNVTSCNWDGSNCIDAGADLNQGVQCVDINESVMCNNIPMLSTCCQWNGTGCQDAPMVSSCHDLQEPPVGAAFCEDYNAKYTESTCEQIAGDPWYMPCEWNNLTEECGFAGDDMFGGDASNFDIKDIGSKGNCEASGGVWKEEKWVDSTGNVFWDEWCEMSFGFDNQFCDDACWACEQQDNGTDWSSVNSSRIACENSKAGCVFQEDSNAFNGLGWCNMDWGKQGNCDDNCFECWDDGLCSDSAAGCKWFVDPWNSSYGWCDSKNVKTCADDCFMCPDQQNCQGSEASCTWDTDSYFCKPSGTGESGESYEICFDGVDNDNDGFFDCSDPECMFDAFCGGSAVFGSDCLSIPDNETCTNLTKHPNYNCTWVVDNWGNEWCDMPGAQCWMFDDDEGSCDGEDGCQYKTMQEFGKSSAEGFCDINFSLMDSSQCWNYGENESVCDGQSGCAWQADKWCEDNPEDQYCSDFNSSNGFMPGFCDHEIWSCNQYDGNKTACDMNSDTCAWQTDWWCSTPEGQADPWCANDPGWCDPVCFARNSSTCLDNVTIGGVSTENVCIHMNNSEMGWCEPENMFKGCWDYDDNETGCNDDSSCVWVEDPFSGGFCGDLFMHQMTGNMDKSPPFYFETETCLSGENETKDICELGVKDDFESLGLVVRVNNMSESAICNRSFEFTGEFTGNKSTKFYWYLDSNGDSTGGCNATDNSSVGGMEFKFKHEAIVLDGEVSETKVAYKCVDGVWSASQIKTNVWPEKMCYMVGGGVVAVDKADLKKLNGYYDETSDMRIYAVTGSETNPYDVIGPSVYTPNSADFKFEDCEGFTDQDGDGLIPSEDSDCIDFFKMGYIDLEKGIECGDGIDNDGNGLVDCNDMGCMYDAYYCNFSSWAEDETAPKITWMEVNPFLDGSFIGIDTDEPTNAILTFYKNDSFCSNADEAIVVYDWKLNNSFELDDYDFWHDFVLENSSVEFVNAGYEIESNSSYYFKVKLCDKSDNCALSACTDFTTSFNVSEYRIGFDLPAPGSNVSEMMGKVEVQFDWGGDGTFDDKIDGAEGFKINESFGRDVDLRFHNPNASMPWSLDFKGADFLKAQDLDVREAFVVNSTSGGDTYVGMDSDKWKEMAQALGVDEVEIVIPQHISNTSAAKLMHCPDNVTNISVEQGCTEINLSDVDCTFGALNSTCRLPSSIGFSVLGISEDVSEDGGDSESSPAGGDAGGSSGGGGGGGDSSVNLSEEVNNDSVEASAADNSEDSEVNINSEEDKLDVDDQVGGSLSSNTIYWTLALFVLAAIIAGAAYYLSRGKKK